jgi:hypothetical protein
MKQGRASISGPADRKVEPNSTRVNPGAVADMGNMQGNHATDVGTFPTQRTEMYPGKGYEAPGIRNINSRKGGSQGKY